MIFNAGILLAYFFGERQQMVVVFGYFVQSLFVGLQTWFQLIVDWWRTSSKDATSKRAQRFLIFFFPVHFGGFHFVYFIFLLIGYSGEGLGSQTLSAILFWAFGWGVLDLLAYMWRELTPSQPNRRTRGFWMAYLRVVPMHLFILLGGLSLGSQPDSPVSLGMTTAFVTFIILKSIGDIVLYKWSMVKPVVGSMEVGN